MILKAANSKLKKLLPWIASLLAAIAVVVTYAALTQKASFGSDPRTVLLILNFDLIVLVVIGFLIARRVLNAHKRSKKSKPTSGLHARLIYTFSMLVAVPIVVMTLFSAVFFHFGVQTWLSSRVQTAIDESTSVAQAYLDEHRQVIKADTFAMASDLGRHTDLLKTNPSAFMHFMRTQSIIRGLPDAMILDSYGNVVVKNSASINLTPLDLPERWIDEANIGDVVLLPTDGENRVRALAKLGVYADLYLLAGRPIDPIVLAHVERTTAAANEYFQLRNRYGDLRITLTLIYIMVGFLILLAAVWFGISFARRLGAPISDLIAAADRVRAGDLSTHVEEKFKFAELGQLAQSFNKMTSQISRAQEELREANRQMNQRRKFTKTVLGGVSSGVIGLDENGNINVVNAAAKSLLNKSEGELIGANIKDAIPEFAELNGESGQAPITIDTRRFLISFSSTEDGGNIITFDDITALEVAQKQAAWADVAMRIAHEIKNPLTPIQLSAERLKRRYANQITQGSEVFTQCVDTIVRSVGDIGKMVDEFSSFARMPIPVMKRCSITKLVEDVVALQKPANKGVDFRFFDKGACIECKCDEGQVRQAITNLLQNAAQAVDPTNGEISVNVAAKDGYVIIEISDNGCGLPEGDLTQPYVTHKEDGTGLGLAIVSKIAEDHGGKLEMRQNPSGVGANVCLKFPIVD